MRRARRSLNKWIADHRDVIDESLKGSIYVADRPNDRLRRSHVLQTPRLLELAKSHGIDVQQEVKS